MTNSMNVYLIIEDSDALSEIATDLEGRLEVLQDDDAGDSPEASDLFAASEWLNEAGKGGVDLLTFPLKLEFDDSNVLQQVKITLENINECSKDAVSARIVEEADKSDRSGS